MAQCTALACPRLRADPDDRSMAINFSSTLVTRDVLGNTWCNHCIKQCELINWGKAHNWPEIHGTGERGRYALAQGEREWQASILTSNQDAINAYHASTVGAGNEIEAVLVENQDRERAMRAKARHERWGIHARL